MRGLPIFETLLPVRMHVVTLRRMVVEHYPGRVVRRADTAAGTTFAGLTLLTHAANFGFVIVGGRLLRPGDFGDLTAILGVVLIGMAPGMAIQALATAGALGRPVIIDRALAWRLAGIIGALVAVVMAGVSVLLDLDAPVTVAAIAVAAAAIPLTAVREGLLQGHGRFVALGMVMLIGAATKFVVGAAGMSLWPTLRSAAIAIAVGYLVQARVSDARTRDLTSTSRPTSLTAPVLYAIALMGALLVVMHLDALIAPAIMPELESGRYAVGVVVSRITFWLPQFLVLLLFPHLVRDASRSRIIRVAGGLVLLATVGLGTARLLGPTFAELAFDAELAVVGPELWRWVWLGAMILGIQFLALIDLATGQRRALPLLLAAVAAVSVWLPLAGLDDAVGVATHVGAILTGTFVIGTVGVLAASRSAVPRV